MKERPYGDLIRHKLAYAAFPAEEGESSKDDIYERSTVLYDAIISYDVQE